MNKKSNAIINRLHIQYPIIQAGMAGGTTTPELVAAVSNAGGLGTLGAGYMSPEQMRTAIRAIKQLTGNPFAVNLFVPEPPGIDGRISKTVINQLEDIEKEVRRKGQVEVDNIGISADSYFFDEKSYRETFHEQVKVIVEEKVPVLSFTFGILDDLYIRQLKKADIVLIGTATHVEEAVSLEAAGVDMIVAQGSEAGGHRGTFAGEPHSSLVGTLALVPLIVDHVATPVIAAGGIMDGRGIAAVMALGAQAAQLGSAFLLCKESGAHPAYQAAICSSDERSTVITKTISGKPARGIRNELIHRLESCSASIPAYPIMNELTRSVRQAAARNSDPQYMSLWAGQAARMGEITGAGDKMEQLVKQWRLVVNAMKME
ncbi:NAD(P)H-dependent flavin oxidoreductase [Paenibacillus alvei]|uniref:NAD(P)H-dependent flavin oxidoreductase n=1 Tax=Paenibacillus alvei TaxID=44250 RepID=UPI0018CEBD7B|nr:nitronate monooxygenase [Paenibacillus alvei]MCY9578519.1 nitronate monooxygenase [Paenibacillus alvei]MCY9584840.1 nitronate monooxygenase [Paenibacillus alvei]